MAPGNGLDSSFPGEKAWFRAGGLWVLALPPAPAASLAFPLVAYLSLLSFRLYPLPLPAPHPSSSISLYPYLLIIRISATESPPWQLILVLQDTRQRPDQTDPCTILKLGSSPCVSVLGLSWQPENWGRQYNWAQITEKVSCDRLWSCQPLLRLNTNDLGPRTPRMNQRCS